MISNLDPLLAFMEQRDFLGLGSKQRAHVKSAPQTLDSIQNTINASILTKSSFETGKDFLDSYSEIINIVLSHIKASPNPMETLDYVLKKTMPENHQSLFSASRQAILDNIPQASKKKLDDLCQTNYLSCMEELDQERAKSTNIMIAIDTTSQEARSKYLNNQFSHVIKGQQILWKRGHTFSSIYDCTHQLFISNQHQNKHKTKHEAGGVQSFIIQLQHTCQVVETAGSNVDMIDGDRGYYDGELYAAAYFGYINKDCLNSKPVRVVVPRKFTRGKDNKKIAFLENPNSLEVTLDSIQLSKYTHPALIDMCKASNLKITESMFEIPIAVVALVDEYGGKKKRSLEELRNQWTKTKKNIANSTERLKTLQDQFVEIQKQVGIKNPKPLSKKTKRKRKTFRNYKVYQAYQAIRKTMIYLESLKASQTKLLNALMFFSISITENEDPLKNPKEFIQIAKTYHERWGIESGFKEDKAKFIRKIRTRKSTQRQWNLTQGMMLYNRWHVARMKEMLNIIRENEWNTFPWDPDRLYIRKKLERKYGHVLKAEGFLLQVLKTGLEMTLDRIFIQ